MSENEEDLNRKGKGHPRGKVNDSRRGGGNRSQRFGKGNRGGKKNYKYMNKKANNGNFYKSNFNRNYNYYENNNKEEYDELKEEDNYFDNYYYKNEYSQKDNFENYNNKKNYRPKPKKCKLTIHELEELSKKDENNIVFYFSNDENIEGINYISEKESCYLLMNILKKISEINSQPAQLIINKVAENTEFLKNIIKNFLEEQSFEEDSYLNFLFDVVKFSNKCLNKFSQKKIDIDSNFVKYQNILKGILEKQNGNLINNNSEKINLIIKEIEDYQKQKKILDIKEYEKKRENEMKKKKENEKNYKEIDIIINPEEFTKNIKYNIAPNKIKGPYDSYEKYINTMFFLEYEDCYRSLRRAVFNLVQEGKSLSQLNREEKWNFERKKHDIYCYLEGEIIKAEMGHEGILITIDFVPLSGKKIKFTKRMINGSLVIITDNDFKYFLLTKVSYNPYIEKKLLEKNENKRRKEKLIEFNIPKEPKYRIKLELININPESFKFLIQNRTNLQLFESKAYFESYIHVLNRLQKMCIPELPFEQEIIKSNFNNLQFNENQDIYKNSTIIPDSLKDKLDESQLEAVKHCLTSKIALIQGPPGTGKTHVGAIITNILRENLKNDSKILIVCFTNHALDQFLENILKENINEDNIIRIGGRCKNEIVKKFVLNSEKYKYDEYRECERQLNQIGKEMSDIIKLIDQTKRIEINEIKKDFPRIYQKIVDDFFKLLNIKKEDYISKYNIPDAYKYKNRNLDLNKIKEDILGSKIFHFWNYTGQKNIQISNLISNIFDDMDIDNYNEIIEASVNFKDYGNDNNKLLNILQNLKNNPKRNKINKLDNDIINDYEAEESEEDDNNSCGYSLEEYDERVNENDYLKEDKLEDDTNLFSFSNLSYDGETSGMNNELILNDDKIEYLLNKENNINFFKIGQTLVKLIINYTKSKKIDEKMCDEKKLKYYAEIMEKKKQINLIIDAKSIEKKQIVAMTTTGCSKYSTILEQMNFEVVIIEEAAEVLEPHILALLTKNTKRLIMIGDHKQLRPKPYSYELSKNYNFDVSMFERFINNGFKYINLKNQRRMKPLFADFTRLIYGKSEYIDKVEEREPIKGMKSDMFIITHEEPEREKEGMKSKCNEYEAQYLVKLCQYLLLQGYKDTQITILTFYIGQVMTILSYLKDSSIKDKNIKVSSVDNYQGEENDIILLSLVRSNKEDIIGFLRTFNRVCVAFSRAKLGFYIIGNIDCIIRGINKLKEDKTTKYYSLEENMFDVWDKIKKEAEKLGIIGNVLELKCQKHGNVTEIKHYRDFANNPEGGCKERCHKRRKCGHACEKFCHNSDCNEYTCTKPCNKLNPTCALGKHKCQKQCFEKCGQCKEKVQIKLKCGHPYICECWESREQDKFKCVKPCEKILKCGHKCQRLCFENCQEQKCLELVKRKLSCNHNVEVPCYLPKYEILCQEECNQILPCKHICSGTCGKCLGGSLHVKCKRKCGKNLVCGHRCEQKCSSECICTKQCPNKCPHGECGDLCCEICVDCVEPCEIKCKHRQCTNLCWEDCNVKPCNERCSKIMKCKHQCMGLCGERCPNVCKICEPNNECFQIFFGNEDDDDALFYKTDCGHVFEYRSMDKLIQNQRNISIPVCPKCLTQLIWEPRYQNYIRNQFKMVQQVKKNYMELNTGKNDEYLKKSIEIFNRIEKQYAQNKISIFDSLIGENVVKNKKNNLINNIIENDPIVYDRNDLKLIIPTIYKLCSNFQKKKENSIKRKLESTYNLMTLAEKFMAIEYMKYEIIKSENEMTKDERKFMKNFFVIKNYFEKIGDSFTYYFFKDLKIKIDNMLYYTILKLKPNISNSSKEIITKIISTNFTSTDLNLKSLYKNYINEKAIFIFGNLGYTWYKCSKGHIYCLDNNNENKINEIECPFCISQNKKSLKNRIINLKEEISNKINNQLEKNPLLNQDQNVLLDLSYRNSINNNPHHHMDEDIVFMMIDHPEWNEYN